MREILFRGKTKNNEWVEGLYLTYDPKRYDCLENPSHVIVNNPEAIGCGLCIQESEMTGKNLAVYSDTVGQYTGLTDKNGKKIFEGDIVHMDSKNFRLSGHGAVVYRNGCFVIDDRKRNRLYIFLQNGQYNAGDYRVDGNIHDNPELLKGGASDGV